MKLKNYKIKSFINMLNNTLFRLFKFICLIQILIFSSSYIIGSEFENSNEHQTTKIDSFKPKELNAWQKSIFLGSGTTGLYYISKYPYALSSVYLLSITLGGHDEIEEILFSTVPAIIYNLTQGSNVGDEGRLEVFATNAGLMVAGHYTYKWFFKKKRPEVEDKKITASPVLLSNYQGLVISRHF
jgi:hypothetical protein